MTDRSPEIIQLVSTILSESEVAREKAQSANPVAFDKRRVASELLVMLHAADELVAFFDPPVNPIEYHGVPRSMTELEDEPHLVVRSEEGFNFLPWYSEKSATLKQQATRLVSDWRRELDDVQMHPKGPATPEETFIEDLLRGLENTRAYAQAIFDMTAERRVMVQEVRFGPEDSN